MIDTNARPHPDDMTFPALGTTEERLRHLVRYAVMAPSSHNSQPWLFGVSAGHLELMADRSRALPVVDPDDRELVMSCGAALFHLRVAARHFGFVPEVELLPRAPSTEPLARMRLGVPGEASAADHALFEAIARRRTSRVRFEERPLAPWLLEALGAAARDEGAWLVVVPDAKREALAALVAKADRLQSQDKHFRRELAAWVHPNRSRSRDGLPGYAIGIDDDVTSVFAPLVLRTFDLGAGQAARDTDLAYGASDLVVVGTRGDGPADWLAAGQALDHVLLRATVDDVSASFLNQPIEVSALRQELVEKLALPGVPQIILRLGYGPGEVRATPRRPVEEVLRS